MQGQSFRAHIAGFIQSLSGTDDTGNLRKPYAVIAIGLFVNQGDVVSYCHVYLYTLHAPNINCLQITRNPNTPLTTTSRHALLPGITMRARKHPPCTTPLPRATPRLLPSASTCCRIRRRA